MIASTKLMMSALTFLPQDLVYCQQMLFVQLVRWDQ